MNRRTFLQATTGVTCTAPQFSPLVAPPVPVSKALLNAYYLRAHMYTAVPRHIREDLKWIKDTGTQVITLAVLEQDLYAAVQNINLVCNEAARQNMQVFALPSRWGGIVAGAPKVPSFFTTTNPDASVLNKDGTFRLSDVTGTVSSVHHPKTKEHFKKLLAEMLSKFPFTGVIWDEPKEITAVDYNPEALKVVAATAPLLDHVKARFTFFSEMNAFIKQTNPAVATCMHIYAQYEELIIDIAAQVGNLDYFGCDGRPWSEKKGGQLESKGKSLIDKGEQFIRAAKRYGKKSQFLIENHNMPATDISLMDEELPVVMSMKPDHLIYYYHPRNIEDPDRNMAVLAKHLERFSR